MVWEVFQKLFPSKCVFLEREIKNADLIYSKSNSLGRGWDGSGGALIRESLLGLN